MSKQQLKFSFTFIGLGALLGWYSHIAYNSYGNKINNNDTLQVETINSNTKNAQSILPVQHKSNSYKEEFTAFISNAQYDKALLFYQNAEPEQQTKLFSILMLKINKLNKKSALEALMLLNVFLQEYYNNSQLLVLKANALILTGETKQALDSFLLAKNYAQDNEDHINISNEIHDFAKLTYKEFEKKKEWSKSIVFYTKLIENEPDFPFYHLCLAESYIKSGDDEMAVTSLQWIKDDIVYGEKAIEWLEIITLSHLSMWVDLDKIGEQYVAVSTLSDFYEVKLLLDTGASYTSLPSYIIAQLVQQQQAEKVGHNQISTAGGMVDADIYKLKKMTIGNFSVNDIIVVELDLGDSQDLKNNFEGLLGMNFLSHFDFSIDQQLNQLFLTPKFNQDF